MAAMPRHDRELLDAIGQLPIVSFAGDAWRATWASRDPLRGSSAGGRWSPAGGPEALYTSLAADGAIAETYHHLSRAPVFSSAHLKLSRLRVLTERTLHLADLSALNVLGVGEADFKSAAHARTQAIGSAAYFLEYDGLMVPSARRACRNLIVFLDRLDLSTALYVEETLDINWPAWKEAQSKP